MKRAKNFDDMHTEERERERDLVDGLTLSRVFILSVRI